MKTVFVHGSNTFTSYEDFCRAMEVLEGQEDLELLCIHGCIVAKLAERWAEGRAAFKTYKFIPRFTVSFVKQGVDMAILFVDATRYESGMEMWGRELSKWKVHTMTQIFDPKFFV